MVAAERPVAKSSTATTTESSVDNVVADNGHSNGTIENGLNNDKSSWLVNQTNRNGNKSNGGAKATEKHESKIHNEWRNQYEKRFGKKEKA